VDYEREFWDRERGIMSRSEIDRTFVRKDVFEAWQEDVIELRKEMKRQGSELRYLMGGIAVAIPIVTFALIHIFK